MMVVCTITVSKRVSFNLGEIYAGSALFDLIGDRRGVDSHKTYSFKLSAETFKCITQGGHSEFSPP